MYFKNILFITIALLLSTIDGTAHNLVPQPQQLTMGKGKFMLSPNAKIIAELPIAEKNRLTEIVRLMIKDTPSQQQGQVITLRSLQTQGDPQKDVQLQQYELRVSTDSINIISPSGMGVFYALQTLRQLVNEDGSVPAVHIKDKPTFRHRGFLLDCSRHFWSKSFILKQLDAMAYFKMNRFHFHLVDGGGWRLEIDKYPELVGKAAYRSHWDWDQWIDHGRQFRDKSEWETSYGGVLHQARY